MYHKNNCTDPTEQMTILIAMFVCILSAKRFLYGLQPKFRFLKDFVGGRGRGRVRVFMHVSSSARVCVCACVRAFM